MRKWVFTHLSAACVWGALSWFMAGSLRMGLEGMAVAGLFALAVILRGAAQR